MLTVVLCLALGCQVTPRTGPGAAARRDPALPFGELDASSENRIEALAQFATGVSVQLTEDLDRALPYYQEAVRLDPHNVKHGAELAKLLLARKQIDEAVALLQELITQNPDAAEPHFVLGVIHNTREQPAEALAAFELAYRLDPTSIDTVQALLHRYLEDDQTEAAGGLLKRALKVKADEARYWLRLADFCVTTRRQAPSLASALGDDHIAACLEKGLALADDEAEPTRSDFLARLATLYEQAGDEAQAGRYYEQLAEAKPDDVAVQLKLANKFLAAGDQEKAAAALEQVIQLEPLRYVRVYNQLAGLYEEMGEDERAVGIYQQSIAVKPDQLLPYLRMTLIHLQHRQYELAAAALDSARNKYPQAYEVAFYQALLFSEQKQYDQAVVAYAEASDLAAASPSPVELPASFYFYYGSACERTGQIEQAARLFQRTIELSPNDHNALNYLGYMWAENGIHLEEAHKLILRALEQEPDNGAYLDSLGWVLFQLGRPAEALPHLERAASLVGDDPTVFEHLADVLIALGRPQEARPYLEQALQLDPDNETLRQKLDQLKNESAITNRA